MKPLVQELETLLNGYSGGHPRRVEERPHMREVTIYRTPLLTLDPNATAGGGLVEVVKLADHDAALRRAKAEVWRDAATVHRQADGNDCKYCLARAAQIEEGE